jgi:hypothetical protein
MKVTEVINNAVNKPAVEIELTGDEVAHAINVYLHAMGVVVRGPRTIRVNGAICEHGRCYVDPSGFVVYKGERLGLLDEEINET